MTKQPIAQELKKEFAQGNLKPSQLKKSKSLNDLPKETIKDKSRRNSVEPIIQENSLTKQLSQAQDQISILELKLETQSRELTELNSLTAENTQLKKELAEKVQQLALAHSELDKSLEARHQALKVFGQAHQKRMQSQQELDNTVEESAEELVNQDQVLSQLRGENFKLKQTNAKLSQDLNLSQRLAEMRRVPYFESNFSPSTYLKYFLYLALALSFALFLIRKKDD